MLMAFSSPKGSPSPYKLSSPQGRHAKFSSSRTSLLRRNRKFILHSERSAKLIRSNAFVQSSLHCQRVLFQSDSSQRYCCCRSHLPKHPPRHILALGIVIPSFRTRDQSEDEHHSFDEIDGLSRPLREALNVATLLCRALPIV